MTLELLFNIVELQVIYNVERKSLAFLNMLTQSHKNYTIPSIHDPNSFIEKRCAWVSSPRPVDAPTPRNAIHPT